MDQVLLRDIIARLERHRQAATYAAVAGVVRANPRTVMRGEDRSHRNSWVVSKQTQRPTNYGPNDYHPDLLSAIEDAGVLDTAERLENWLALHPLGSG